METNSAIDSIFDEKADAKINIKQRIVGAIVIFCIAIIVLPIIFKPNDELAKQFKVNSIPPIPEQMTREFKQYNNKFPKLEAMPELPQPKAIPIDKYNQDGIDDVVIKTSQKANYKNAKKPTVNDYSQSYTIQIGSFSKKQNAINLDKKLRAKHFKSYIEKVSLTSGQSYRVRVGPYLKYDQITAIQKKVKRQFKVDARIVNHQQ